MFKVTHTFASSFLIYDDYYRHPETARCVPVAGSIRSDRGWVFGQIKQPNHGCLTPSSPNCAQGAAAWQSPATATLLLPCAVINWGLPSQPQPCCNVLQQLSLRVQFRVWQGEELHSSSNTHQIIPRAEAQNYRCSSPPLSSRFSSIITAILATRSLE